MQKYVNINVTGTKRRFINVSCPPLPDSKTLPLNGSCCNTRSFYRWDYMLVPGTGNLREDIPGDQDGNS